MLNNLKKICTLLRWPGLVFLGLLIYGQTFQFGFVFDDQYFIVNNPAIRGFGHVHLMWANLPKTRLIGIYTFAFNYVLGQLNPTGYHIFNFVIHLICVGLVWGLADLLFKITKMPREGLSKHLPYLIAVLFLVHPGQTQAISYISQRFESMAAMFYLSTVYLYLTARLCENRIRQTALFALCALCAVAGIFTKEVVMTVPIMIIVSEWILFPKKSNRIFYMILCVIGVLLFLLFRKILNNGLSIFFNAVPSDSHPGEILTPAHYFLTQMRVFLTFLRLLILPILQNADYDYHVSTGFISPPLTLLGFCTIGGIIYLILKLRQTKPLIAFGLAWILITFSINLAPRANVIFEHKLYLISFGFFLTLASGLSLYIKNNQTLLRTLLCLTAFWAILSFQRNHIWREEFTLWDDVIKHSPHKGRPYNNRGLAWDRRGNPRMALADFNKAIEMEPSYINAYINRGFLLSKLGALPQALADDDKAVNLNPKLAGAYINRGQVYDKMGHFNEALADYNKAISLKDNLAESYNDRANVYFKMGNLPQAIADYNKALTFKTDYADVYYNLAFIYYRQGRFADAVDNYSKTLEINPKDASTYYNRAVAYYQLKEYAKAWIDVKQMQALGANINPQLINALKNTGA